MKNEDELAVDFNKKVFKDRMKRTFESHQGHPMKMGELKDLTIVKDEIGQRLWDSLRFKEWLAWTGGIERIITNAIAKLRKENFPIIASNGRGYVFPSTHDDSWINDWTESYLSHEHFRNRLIPEGERKNLERLFNAFFEMLAKEQKERAKEFARKLGIKIKIAED